VPTHRGKNWAKQNRLWGELKYSTQYHRIESSGISIGRTTQSLKTRWFQRFARKEKIGDAVLLDAIARAEKGEIDAELDCDVIKQRITGAEAPIPD
jgi:RelE toxin of RelE / RelB toxin-antitoxin system